jgi:glycosyltransferase involved in cell wall biosynthesis
LRVCLDARLVSGENGGVEQFIIGLASGLAALDDGDEEYLFLVYEGSVDWLQPFLGGACTVLLDGSLPQAPKWKRWAKRVAPFTRSLWHQLTFLPDVGTPALPTSSGSIERAAIDVMHFTQQSGFSTKVPSIYHPHDLQYLHLPEFFSPRTRRALDFKHRRFCAQATMVSVSSCWVKQDVVSHFGLPEDKVRVVSLAAPLQAYEEPSRSQVATMSATLALPESFIFYPAHTWPHKNHIELLHALRLLRDRHGLCVPLVCSGERTRYFPEIESFAVREGLADQVTFLGFVSPLAVQCLYRLCRAVVIPTRFEAASFPMMEAFSVGVAVACSNVTSLPEQAGDAALVFDPNNHVQIAEAILRLWTDPILRETLGERGRIRQQALRWTDTARHFRAHYRLIGERDLTDEDELLLSRDPCKEGAKRAIKV